MFKSEWLWVAVFLGILVMCLCVLTFWMMLKFAIQEGERKHERSENQKAAILLREEREKFENLLKSIKEKDE